LKEPSTESTCVGGAYSHGWFRAWWFALIGTAAFEAFLVSQVYRYGHRELWPHLSRRAFTGLLVLVVFTAWPLVNVALIRSLPPAPPPATA
jgi:hypothetical protein